MSILPNEVLERQAPFTYREIESLIAQGKEV
jgi:hypothetical protein